MKASFYEVDITPPLGGYMWGYYKKQIAQDVVDRLYARAVVLKQDETVVAIVTGEGSSGGALAIGVADSVWMLENAVYSILSPEGFASILWKDSKRAAEACAIMKITPEELKNYGLIDGIIPEGKRCIRTMDTMLEFELNRLSKLSESSLVTKRYEKYRAIDGIYRPGKL